MERPEQSTQPVTAETLARFDDLLRRYRAGKAKTEQRILNAENWWRLRNRTEEEKAGVSRRSGFVSESAWLHNVITNKHADAMDSFPAPVILPREAGDARQARLLSAVIPCVLERNHFDEVYSEVMWQKLKFGTGCYKVVWDPKLLGGLGDISVTRQSLLNLYWEPGVADLQKSRYLFDVENLAEDSLREQYPGLPEHITSGFRVSRFPGEDRPEESGMTAVIGVYYRKNGLLHYCKYVGSTLLESTENDPELRQRGLYDHGLYPYVTDPLFPIEGSPCGSGYVDLCRNAQTEIDLLKTAIVRNAMAGATPRHFIREDGAVNEEEYLDTTRPLVHVSGSLGEESLRIIPHAPLDGIYMSVLNETISELRETSANTETATGQVSGNVTAAAAITALQQASGKTGRDAMRGSYRAFCRIVELCVELIRQFYTVPRCFRITGSAGSADYVSFGNRELQLQHQGTLHGVDLGWRKPVFDIRIDAQKKNAYASAAQNEIVLRLWQMGFFDPANRERALPCLELLDLDGKELLLQTLNQQEERSASNE